MDQISKPLKIAVIVVRLLMGALFAWASLAYFFELGPRPELSGTLKTVMDGFEASGYLLQTIKGTELLCAIALLSGRFVPLSLVVLAPISINILLFHAFVAPEGLPTAIVVVVAHLFLAWATRRYYAALLSPKPLFAKQD